MPSPERIANVVKALEEIRAGRMVILVDDEDRENEGDLTMAADLVTPEAVNFMARHGRGLICLSMTEERVAQLGLPMMTSTTDNRSLRGTAFTVSIDAREGISTGISARERAHTVAVAVDKDAGPDDVVMPGHVFPLRARPGGVLVRSGHTEGSVDLARMSGRSSSAVICEIMREDGEMARMPDLQAFAREHGLHLLSIADLIEYRLSEEILVKRQRESVFQPKVAGVDTPFQAYVYTTDVEDTEYLALVLGDMKPEEPTLVRVQTASVLRDVFMPGGGPAVALRMIQEAGRGVMLYVYPRGRASLAVDFDFNVPVAAGQPAPALAPSSAESRLRSFGLGAQVLADLGVKTIRLISNRPRRVVGLEGFGLQIVGHVPLTATGHLVSLPAASGGSRQDG